MSETRGLSEAERQLLVSSIVLAANNALALSRASLMVGLQAKISIDELHRAAEALAAVNSFDQEDAPEHSALLKLIAEEIERGLSAA